MFKKCNFPSRYYCDYCDTYLTHDSVSFSIYCYHSLNFKVTAGLPVVSMSASHAVGRCFASWQGHSKDHRKNGTNCLPAWHAGIRIGV